MLYISRTFRIFSFFVHSIARYRPRSVDTLSSCCQPNIPFQRFSVHFLRVAVLAWLSLLVASLCAATIKFFPLSRTISTSYLYTQHRNTHTHTCSVLQSVHFSGVATYRALHLVCLVPCPYGLALYHLPRCGKISVASSGQRTASNSLCLLPPLPLLPTHTRIIWEKSDWEIVQRVLWPCPSIRYRSKTYSIECSMNGIPYTCRLR